MKRKIYLCDDCLKCRDPELYCKFRESCPVWFMTKKKAGLDADFAPDRAKDIPLDHRVVFGPEGQEIRVLDPPTLEDALSDLDRLKRGLKKANGDIEKVTIDPATLEPESATVGDQPPRGICGSGMIDLMAELLKVGIIDRRGHFATARNHSRVVTVNDEPGCVLAFAEQTPMKEDIVFTASDLKNLIYIDFSSNPRYMDEFTSALFLPHTNLEMFPSIAA
jgi:hypothetical protein